MSKLAEEMLRELYEEHLRLDGTIESDWVHDDMGDAWCHYCSEDKPDHEDDCWFMRLVEFYGGTIYNAK